MVIGATPLVDRDRALPLALALLAIVSLALAAATLDSAVVGDTGPVVGGGEDGFGDERRQSGDRSFGTPAEDTGGGTLSLSTCWPVVREPPVLAAIGLVFLGLFAAVYRSTRSAFAGVVVCGGVALPVGFAWGLLAICAQPMTGVSRNGTGIGVRNWSSSGGASGGGGASTLSSPTILLVLLAVLAVAVLAVAVLVGRNGGEGDASEGESVPGPDEDTAETIGRVAGVAADRIDDEAVDAENEVYRAWREMTDSLDVESPETTTPREFQRAAVDAGMTPDDVSALTSLFESVRYGDREATEEIERRAVETLRRIESCYGGR